MNRSSSSRRGYLLVEMLVVIGVSSALAAVAVGLLASLVRVERVGRRHFDQTNALLRLSKQFRRDVAAAEQATFSDADVRRSSELLLRMSADITVTYRAEPGRLLRLENEGPTTAAREMFTLPATAEARFDVDERDSGTFVVLMLDAPTPGNRAGESGAAEGGAQNQSDKRQRLLARDGVGRRGWSDESLIGRNARQRQIGSEAMPTTTEAMP